MDEAKHVKNVSKNPSNIRNKSLFQVNFQIKGRLPFIEKLLESLLFCIKLGKKIRTTKLEWRPQILVKVSFTELSDSELSDSRTFDDIAIPLS